MFPPLQALAASAPLQAKRTIPPNVPSYVTDYAPMLYLHTADPYRPADLSAQIANTQPEVNSTLISTAPSPLTLDNLNALNTEGDNGGADVYLTSTSYIDVNSPDNMPVWTKGVLPNSNGETEGAVSCAVIVIDHGSSGLVDVFYMYFYAFNWGGVYLDALNLGNHVGDWEHNMVRFQNGEPQAVWYSQHANGEAFTYGVTQKFEGGTRVSESECETSESTYLGSALRALYVLIEDLMSDDSR